MPKKVQDKILRPKLEFRFGKMDRKSRKDRQKEPVSNSKKRKLEPDQDMDVRESLVAADEWEDWIVCMKAGSLVIHKAKQNGEAVCNQKSIEKQKLAAGRGKDALAKVVDSSAVRCVACSKK